MYITNFKFFGYYLPLWRKMQTKLKVQSENAPGSTFLGSILNPLYFD
jgi:hypothetical protein